MTRLGRRMVATRYTWRMVARGFRLELERIQGWAPGSPPQQLERRRNAHPDRLTRKLVRVWIPPILTRFSNALRKLAVVLEQNGLRYAVRRGTRQLYVRALRVLRRG